MVSQFFNPPYGACRDHVNHTLKYIKATAIGLTFENQGHARVVGYLDVDWVHSPTNRRTTCGYCIFVGGNLMWFYAGWTTFE